MWSYEQALESAKQWVRLNSNNEAVVLEDVTITKPYGWVFFYQSRAFIETGEVGQRLAGNAPIIFDRFDGELRVTGTAEPIEHYLREYERTLPRARLGQD